MELARLKAVHLDGKVNLYGAAAAPFKNLNRSGYFSATARDPSGRFIVCVFSMSDASFSSLQQSCRSRRDPARFVDATPKHSLN